MDPPHENPPDTQSAQAITFARVRLCSMIGLGFALIALLLLAWRTTRLEKFTLIFEDFDMELPTLTQWVMQFPPLVYLLSCVITAALLIWKEFALRDKGMALIINVTAAGVAMVLWLLLQMAIMLPMEQLIFDVSQ